MSTTYHYSVSGDFLNGVNPSTLFQEIINEIATPTLEDIIVDGDDVAITFSSALSVPQQTTLDNIVASHVAVFDEEILTDGYINIQSQLADNRAIRILASDTNGGIDIDAGFGGITIDSTNGISIDGGAFCNFSTSNGNILIYPEVGNLELQSGNTGSGGINLGTDPVDQSLNIGTGTGAKHINIGNNTSDTRIDIVSGTGGFFVDTTSGGQISLDAVGASSNFSLTSTGAGQDLTLALLGSTDSSLVLSSQGTGADAIRLDTTGGIDADASGTINFSSGNNTGSAITLDAAFNNGGITISSGTQGIAINSNGGLIGIGGFNGGDIQIGNAAIARTVTIGNQTTTTSVVLNCGTNGLDVNSTGQVNIDSTNTASDAIRINSSGGIDADANGSINLTSTSTASDAIRLNTGGGIDVDATGTINLATGNNTGGAITLDAAFNNGGITISSGTQGIAINSNGGLIGIGGFNGGDIQIGNAAVARAITIGNTTSTTSVAINSGTFGITIGNNANGGEIQIGNVANAKTITVGNNTGSSRLLTRWGTNGNIKTQLTETALSDANANLTTTNLLSQILTISPSTDRTLTLPGATAVVADISGVQVNDAIDFTVIHGSTGASDPFVSLAMGAGGTGVGFMEVHPRVNNAGTYISSGSGTFRMRLTNVTASSEAYTIYRMS